MQQIVLIIDGVAAGLAYFRRVSTALRIAGGASDAVQAIESQMKTKTKFVKNPSIDDPFLYLFGTLVIDTLSKQALRPYENKATTRKIALSALTSNMLSGVDGKPAHLIEAYAYALGQEWQINDNNAAAILATNADQLTGSMILKDLVYDYIDKRDSFSLEDSQIMESLGMELTQQIALRTVFKNKIMLEEWIKANATPQQGKTLVKTSTLIYTILRGAQSMIPPAQQEINISARQQENGLYLDTSYLYTNAGAPHERKVIPAGISLNKHLVDLANDAFMRHQGYVLTDDHKWTKETEIIVSREKNARTGTEDTVINSMVSTSASALLSKAVNKVSAISRLMKIKEIAAKQRN